MSILSPLLLLAVCLVGISGFPTIIASSSPRMRVSFLDASVASGDTVVVVGGTGGVGQLVTKKLASRGDLTVKATSRSKQKGIDLIDDDAVEVVALDLVNDDEATINKIIEGANALVISVGTTAFPTQRWAGGNTPEAVDKVAVSRIATAASSVPSMKKIVLVTSVGVDRTKEMPFLILNLFGVLDAKKSGEDAVKKAATDGGFEYAIVRPGRLVGGPFTNLDIAKLLKVEGGAENGVDVAQGDSLLGDCKRDACAEAIVQCLVNDACTNVEFSLASNDEKALSDEQWTQAFQSL